MMNDGMYLGWESTNSLLSDAAKD